jgi:tetratricopeptide (TPR) repeat protein
MAKLFTSILFVVLMHSALAQAEVVAEGVQAQLSRAVELENKREFLGAETIYRQVLLTSGDDPEILKRLGLVYQRQGKYQESIEAFQKIIARAPVYPGVNSLLAVSYYELNHFDKTIEAAQKELIGNPKDKQARYYQSLALSATGRLYEAIQQLESLLKDDPNNLPIAYQLAVDYKVAAQQASQRIAKMAPDSDFTHAMRAESLADADRFSEALSEFNEVLRKNPDFPGIHLAIGQICWRQKDLDKAKQELKIALTEEPRQPLANYYLADILTTDKQYAEAIPHLEIAIAVYPELTRAYWLLGKCHAATGNVQRAVEAYNKALEQNPRYKEVHFQLHELYARQGKKTESQDHLEMFERLTREDQNKDRESLQNLQKKNQDSGINP